MYKLKEQRQVAEGKRRAAKNREDRGGKVTGRD